VARASSWFRRLALSGAEHASARYLHRSGRFAERASPHRSADHLVVLARTAAADPVARRIVEIDQTTGRPIRVRAGTGCSVPSTSSDAREAVAPDVPAQLAAVPRSGRDLVRPTALVVAGAGVIRWFMERGPRPERAEHQDARERVQGLVSHGKHSSDGVTVVGGGGVTLASPSATENMRSLPLGRPTILSPVERRGLS